MKKLINIPIIFLGLGLASCSTMFEVMTEGDSASGYHKSTDGSGKYVRKRIVSKSRNRPPLLLNPSDNLYDFDDSRPSQRASNITVLAHSVTAAGNDSEPSGLSLGFSNSLSEEDSNFHLGLEVEAPFAGGWVMGRAGMSLFGSDYLYGGGTLGARVMVPEWRLSPYVGVETYLGDHKSCEYEDIGFGEQIETCEKTFLMTLYTELGLRLKISERLNLYAFTRGYSKVDQTIREDLSMFYGGSLFFNY